MIFPGDYMSIKAAKLMDLQNGTIAVFLFIMRYLNTLMKPFTVKRRLKSGNVKRKTT